MPDIFLSYSKEDSKHARALREWLQAEERGWRTFIYETEMEIGNWEADLRRNILRSDLVVIFHSKAWVSSVYCQKEMFQAQEHSIPTVVLHLPGSKPEDANGAWLSEKQHFALDPNSTSDPNKVEVVRVDRNGAIENVNLSATTLLKISNFLETVAPTKAEYFELSSGIREPYPGLRPLRVEEAGLFYGRDDEVRACIQSLRMMVQTRESGILLIDGPSGAGKSSFLRAGILARLQRAKGEYFTLPLVTITTRPISDAQEGLRAALLQTLVKLNNTTVSVDTFLNANTTELAASLRRGVDISAAEKLPIVLTVDQGEELLLGSGGAGAQERTQFWKALHNLLESNSRIFLVTTIRHELHDQFRQRLPAAVAKETFSLGPLPKARLDDIIEKPLARPEFKARQFHPNLVEQLTADVLAPNLSNALPLLAFTLQRLWSRSSNPVVLANEYRGLAHSLVEATQEAREELATALFGEVLQYDERMSRSDIRLFNFLFRYFVTVDQQGRESTRRCFREDISDSADQTILEKLLRRRIIVGGHGSASNQAGFYELAHEGIVTEWADLKREIEQRRNSFSLRARLETCAEIWFRSNETPLAAVINLLDKKEVERISEGDISNFANNFENLTGAPISQLTQRFVEAWSEEEAHRARATQDAIEQALGKLALSHASEQERGIAEHQAAVQRLDTDYLERIAKQKDREEAAQTRATSAETGLKNERKANTRLLGAIILLAAVCVGIGGLLVSKHVEDSDQLKRILRAEQSAAATTASAEQAIAGASEAMKVEQQRQTQSEIEACWAAFANPQQKACWSFRISTDPKGMLYTCAGGNAEELTMSPTGASKRNGDVLTYGSDELLLHRGEELLAVYSKVACPT